MSQLTGQTIPIAVIIFLLIKTLRPDQSNPKYYARRRWFFSKNSWKKPFLIFKLSGRAMVRPASSDKWKASKVLQMERSQNARHKIGTARRVEPSFVFLREEDKEEAPPESRQAFEFAAARILDLSFMFSLVKLVFSSSKILLLISRWS